MDRKRRVWVCDNGNARLQVFDSNGVFERQIPVDGWRREVFSEPQAAADPSGGVWVTVPLAGEVRLYGPDGKLVRKLRGPSDDTLFTRPMGVAVKPGGSALYVSDLSGKVLLVPLSSSPKN